HRTPRLDRDRCESATDVQSWPPQGWAASGVRVELDTASDQPRKRERHVGASRNTSLRRQIRRSISGRASVVQARERARAATWASYAATLPKPENHAKTVSPSLTGS